MMHPSQVSYTCEHALSQPILNFDANILAYTIGSFLCCLHSPEEWAGVYLLYVFALNAQRADIDGYAGGQTPQRKDPVASAANKPATSDLAHELAGVLALSTVGHQSPEAALLRAQGW